MAKLKPMTKRQQRLHTTFIITLGSVVFLSILLFAIIFANWAAIKNELVYAMNGPQVTPSTAPSAPVSPVATIKPVHEPAHIQISKIGVDAPLQWNIAPEATLDALNHGVAHLAGSARLGQVGNLFITGHSSDYVWKQNPYAAVFSLLPKLTQGDEITIREHGKFYTYKIVETKIVKPDQVEVAKPTTTPVLTLMTCYPIGTTKERFVVHAALVTSSDKITGGASTTSFTVPQIEFR